ncbi:unnamed protein product [Hyaloperonospora brassicae]|uniref:SCP domain-containing protein n=1 Tax=Hyaloperonospora brassicae TaxID=162125 RepID=A0AAV0UKJ1_HYABA|nr:unnamed protein product [Hyaloperonospora brassicae]
MITKHLLPLALLVVCPASFNTAVTASDKLPIMPRNAQTYTQYSEYYQETLDAVNDERSKAGLAELCINKKLSAAAKRHGDDMAAHDFMDHAGSDGSTMTQRISATGYEWDAIAENVAAGQNDVASVMQSWMDSDGHRANILGTDYTMMGIAYAYSAGSKHKHFWAQEFGAGETEACDSKSATNSSTTGQAQEQTQDDRVTIATKVQEPSYTMGPPTPTTTITTTPSATTVPSTNFTSLTTTPTAMVEPPIVPKPPIVPGAPTAPEPPVTTKRTRACKAKK